MSDEVILETITAELDAADAATLKSIWQNLREAKQKVGVSPDTAHKRTSQFIGENHPWTNYGFRQNPVGLFDAGTAFGGLSSHRQISLAFH